MFTRTQKKPSNQSPLTSQAHTESVLSSRHSISPDTHTSGETHHAPTGSSFHFQNIAVVQPKLTIGKPNDRYEQEADRVADQVMSMDNAQSSSISQAGSGTVQRTCTTCTNEYNAAAEQDRSVDQDNLCPKCRLQAKPLAQQITPLVQRNTDTGMHEEEEETLQAKSAIQRQVITEKEDEEEQTNLQQKPLIQRQVETNESEEDEEEQTNLQRKSLIQRQVETNESEEDDEDVIQSSTIAGHASTAGHSVASGVNAMQSGGQPLASATRAFMEPRFGHDFSRVRIHTNSNAARTAKQINARAFTFGKNIAFNTGYYQPNTANGKKLIAHELTHVVQQNNRVAPRRLAAKKMDRPWKINNLSVGNTCKAVPQVLRKPDKNPEPHSKSANTRPTGKDPYTGLPMYGHVPSNTVRCLKKWQYCRAPYRPGTWAARVTYHCPRLVLPFGIILPGTTRPAYVTIPDEFTGYSRRGTPLYRCRPKSSVMAKLTIGDSVATLLTRSTLFPNYAACHAGFRGNLLTTLNTLFRPSGGGRPAGVRVNQSPPGGSGRPFPC